MIGVRLRGPLHKGHGQAVGILAWHLGSQGTLAWGLGHGDPCLMLRLGTWGPLLWVWDAGTLMLGLGSGLGPVWGDTYVRARTRGHLHWGQDLGTTIWGP